METPNQSNLRDDKHILNRQINYTIIRMMWDAVNKGLGVSLVRGYENDTSSLTGTFEISKYKWDSIVKGETRNIGLKKLPEALEKKTGISKDVFTGEERIHLNDEMDKIVETLVSSTSKDTSKHKTSPRSKLFQYLKQVDPNYDENKTLYTVCYFIRNKQPFIIGLKDSSEIKQLSLLLKGISLKRLDRLSSDDLKEYRRALFGQYKLVDALITYRKNM